MCVYFHYVYVFTMYVCSLCMCVYFHYVCVCIFTMYVCVFSLCMCVHYVCVCIFTMYVCVFSLCMCVFSLCTCVCNFTMYVCVFSLCMCVHYVCVCIFTMYVCSLCMCVISLCMCVCNFEHVAIDIVGPFPRALSYKYLFTYICLSSKYPEAIPLKKATAAECAEALLEIFSRNGVPVTLLSDQGSQFMGVLVTTLCKRLGISQLRTTPYHPQTNGSVERLHGTLVPMIRKLSSKKLLWPDQVKFALYAIRSTPNRSTGFAPFEIIYGHNMKSPLDIVIQEIEPRTSRNLKAEEWLTELNQRVRLIREQVVKNMESAQKDRKQRYDEGCVVRNFSKGDMV